MGLDQNAMKPAMTVGAAVFLIVGVVGGYFKTFSPLHAIAYGLAAAFVVGMMAYQFAYVLYHPRFPKGRPRKRKRPQPQPEAPAVATAPPPPALPAPAPSPAPEATPAPAVSEATAPEAPATPPAEATPPANT
jgi:hypothetical protein